ncbi:MAG: lysophospholipid acyltransferase family protein [Candidatus Binatia bacterium]|nr:lysophospholipid acyltransferase family protein [Candidatus Binatia bacterium]
MKDYFEYWLLRAAYGFLAVLPRPWAIAVGAAFGHLVYWLAWPLRTIALGHLALAFPQRTPKEHRAILQACARNLGRMAAEVAHFHKLNRENVGDYVRIDEPALWREVVARQDGRGLIVLTAHFGNWELLAYFHGLMGVPVTLIHRPMRNKLVNDWLVRLRGRAGTRSIEKKAAAREALRILREGGILAIPADQNQRYSFGVFVDFFGIPACTTTGPVRLAQHSGARIVPVFLRRVGESSKHVVEVWPPVELVETGDPQADLVENTQRCSRILEEMIRRYPEQWIWFHRRWKTRPPMEQSQQWTPTQAPGANVHAQNRSRETTTDDVVANRVVV